MNRARALFSTLACAAPAALLLGIGALFLAGSAAVAWSAWYYTWAEMFKATPGRAFLSIVAGIAGVTVALLKAHLSFVCGLLWDHNVPFTVMAIAAWLCCLVICWLVAVLAALELPIIATLPEKFIIFWAAVWFAFEVLAGLLLVVGAVAWTAAREASVWPGAMTAASASNNRSNAEPAYRNLMELLEQVSFGSAPADIADIKPGSDCTIHTTTSALARSLGLAKSTVHGQLRSLHADGRIILRTTPIGSQIKVVGPKESQRPQDQELGRHWPSEPNTTVFGRTFQTLTALRTKQPVPGVGQPVSSPDASRLALGPGPNALNAPEFSAKFCRIKGILVSLRGKIGVRDAHLPPRPG